MGYRIAHFADTHLGYSARCRSNSRGVNERVMDGLRGLDTTVSDILAAGVDLVLHGGDLFHRSAPGVGEIAFARQQLERFAAAGLPVIGATGNHDFATDRGKSSATAAVHDPGRNIHMVTGPYARFDPVDGLVVQVVSHAGLIGVERSAPEPVDGTVSIFMTHGAAQVPGTDVFTCVDSPGEAVIGYDMLTMDWAVTLLGHYHKRGALPGFHQGSSGQAWYAGSLLRRGFSDPAGGRGWLLVEIGDDGAVTVTPQNVAQRPQHDLAVIDANGMTGSQVEELIRGNLASVEIGDAILRQRVVNCPVSVRRGIDTAALKELTADALVWQPEFLRPSAVEIRPEAKTSAAASLATASGADLPDTWRSWFDGYAENVGLNDALRPPVAAGGEALLKQVSADAETVTASAGEEPA